MNTLTRHRVVGMRAGSRTHVLARLSALDPVLLITEPDNAHDRYAIAVYHAPAALMTGDVLSSVKDPHNTGHVNDTDRETLLARHAGYVPREAAAQYRLPVQGLVGWVSAVRYPPEEQWVTDDGSVIKRVSLIPAGFDVAAAFEDWRR